MCVCVCVVCGCVCVWWLCICIDHIYLYIYPNNICEYISKKNRRTNVLPITITITATTKRKKENQREYIDLYLPDQFRFRAICLEKKNISNMYQISPPNPTKPSSPPLPSLLALPVDVDAENKTFSKHTIFNRYDTIYTTKRNWNGTRARKTHDEQKKKKPKRTSKANATNN